MDISKLLITNDNMAAVQLLNGLASSADATQTNLSQLPLQHTAIQNTLKFVNQLNSYSKFISEKLTRNEALPEDYKQTVSELYQTCTSINGEMSEVSDEIAMHKINVSQLSLNLKNNAQNAQLPNVLGNVENDTIKYPTLIFDGPFSDGQEDNTPKTVRPDVTNEDAQKALEILFQKTFASTGEMSGDIASFGFKYEGKDDFAQADVAKAGGLLNWYLSTRAIGDATLDASQAQQKAEEFSARLNYGTTKVVWKEQYDNTIIFNFAPVIDDVVIYPDVFKVKVALDNGEIVGFEGHSYIINNHIRELPKPVINMEDAKAKVNKDVAIETNRLCIAPLDNKEVLCWEFYGKLNELSYVIYISAIDGTEQGVLRIITTETGEMIL